jgi:anti-sigma B factor antagonist
MSEGEKAATDSAAAPFAVSSEVVGGATVIAVQGELDLSTAPRLQESIQAAGEFRSMVLDLSGCDFIDSTGIALLVHTFQGAGERGGKVALCGLRDQLLRVLKIAGIEDLIPTRGSREDALAVVSA